MNTITTQQITITNNEGHIVGTLTGEAGGMRLSFFSTENPGEVLGSLFSNSEGFFVQAKDGEGRTVEIDATGVFAFNKGQDAPVAQFPMLN